MKLSKKVNEHQKNPEVYKAICDVLEKSKDSLEARRARILYNFF